MDQAYKRNETRDKRPGKWVNVVIGLWQEKWT